MKAELARRQSGTAEVIAVFTARPHRWIHWRRFFAIAPCAWRTRISNARKQLGVIEWNGRPARSAYRFRPDAQGREASTFVPGNPETGTLFDTWPSGWQR